MNKCSLDLHFIRDHDNPLSLSKGTARGYLHPDAHYFEEKMDGYRYWLFYTPYPYEPDELPYLMRSNDGKNFTDDGVLNPLLKRGPKDSWEDHHLGDVDVICVNDAWHMYYCGAHFDGRHKHAKIGVAISKNGKTWSKYEGNPILEPDPNLWWEAGCDGDWGPFVECPAVVYHDGIFFMLYTAVGGDGKYRFGLATSKDGFEFEKAQFNPILSPEYSWEGFRIDHCDVVNHNGEFWMYYVGRLKGLRAYGVLCFARTKAEDPRVWFKHERPVLLPNPVFGSRFMNYLCQQIPLSVQLFGSFVERLFPNRLLWESGSIYRSSPLSDGKGNLVAIDGRMYLYYSAFDLWYTPRIGLAKSAKVLSPRET